MCNFWLKYGLYGCILGLMGRKIWTRAHEESKINLRPVFQPDSSGRTLSPVDSYQNMQDNFYQNMQPVEYTYATRPIIQDQAEAERAIADYRRAHGSCNAAAVRNQGIICNGRTYPNAAALFQEMEQQAIRGGSGTKYNNITIITARR